MRIKSKNLITQNQLFSVFLCHVIDHDGIEVRDYLILEPNHLNKNKISGVAILPCYENQVALINIERPAMEGKFWEIPHGGIEPGESEIEACIRELREETGLVAKTRDFIHISTVAPDSGIISGAVAIYVANVSNTATKSKPELGISGSKFFPVSEVLKLIEQKQILDSYSQVAIFKSLTQGQLSI